MNLLAQQKVGLLVRIFVLRDSDMLKETRKVESLKTVREIVAI